MFKGLEEKTEILAIPKKYKNILKDLINISNIKPPIMLKPVDKRPRNVMANLENSPTKPELDNLTESQLDKIF